MSKQNQQLIVVTSNFQSFIATLKSNLKLGYGVCESTEFLNGFFRAALVQGADSVYVAKLDNISGGETENVVDLVDHLGDTKVQKLQPKVEKKDAVEPDIVIVKPKAPRKPRAKKGE